MSPIYRFINIKRKHYTSVLFTLGGALLLSFLTLAHEYFLHPEPILFSHLWISGLAGGLLGAWIGRRVQQAGRTLDSLRESEERYRDLFENANDLIQCVGADGRILYANRAWRQTLGYEEEELRQLNMLDFIHPDSRSHCLDIFQRLQEGQSEACGEFQFISKDGRAIRVEGNCNFRFENGRAVSSRGIFRDITSRHQIDTALLESEESLSRSLAFTRTILNSMNDAIAIIDVEDRILLGANNVLLHSLGKEEHEIIGRKCAEITCLGSAPCDAADKPCPLHLVLETGEHCQVEHAYQDQQGHLRYAEISASPVRDKEGKIVHVVQVKKDITQRKNAELRVKQLAYFDSLTGLPNRLLLLDRLSQALGRARRDELKVGVLFLDLNGFKAINDTLGHEKGDMVLKEVSRRLKSCVRATDTVGRLGGDEFVVVIAGIQDIEVVREIGAKILDSLSRPISLDGLNLSATPSIGAAIFPDHGANAGSLLRVADQAMYQAKEMANDQILFYDPAGEAAAQAPALPLH